MHIFALEFLELETETMSHVTNDLQSNKLTCCKVSVVPLEKYILTFDKIRFGKFSGSFKAPNDTHL